MKKLPPEIKKEMTVASMSGSIKVPILMYHYIEYVQDKRDTIRQSLNVNPDIFELQLQALVGAKYNFMTARELGEVLDGKMKLPEKPILQVVFVASLLVSARSCT